MDRHTEECYRQSKSESAKPALHRQPQQEVSPNLKQGKKRTRSEKRGQRSHRGPHGSQNQVSNKVDPPSDFSSQPNNLSSKKNQKLRQAQRKHSHAKAEFYKEYSTLKEYTEKDAPEIRDKKILVQMLHLERCQCFMEVKAIEATSHQIVNNYKEKRDLVLYQMKKFQSMDQEYRKQQSQKKKQLSQSLQQYKDAISNNLNQETIQQRKQIYDNTKERLDKISSKFQVLMGMLNDIDSKIEQEKDSWTSKQELAEEEKEIQRIKQDIKQIWQKGYKWNQKLLQNARPSDPDLRESEVQLEEKPEGIEKPREARMNAYESMKKRYPLEE